MLMDNFQKLSTHAKRHPDTRIDTHISIKVCVSVGLGVGVLSVLTQLFGTDSDSHMHLVTYIASYN